MLINGQFVKEPPPRIGAYWIPSRAKAATPEEQFTQDVLLGVRSYRTSAIKKVLGRLLSI